MLKLFPIDAYALLDLGATLFFVNPLIAKIFDILPDILREPYIVSVSVCE